MSDIRLFRLIEDGVEAITGSSMAIEKSLQTLIEQHLETFLGVRFLASEYATTKSHGGRIDTLGIDELNCPVIIEYKRALNENVINQGLYYLNWLMDHRGEFKLLVLEQLGLEAANAIEWRYPRLICIAGDFTKYDAHAIQQIPQNIDLIRYQRFGDDLLLLEHAARSSSVPTVERRESRTPPANLGNQSRAPTGEDLRVQKIFNECAEDVQERYRRLEAFIMGLGDDVEPRILPSYFAFRRLKSFAYVKISSVRGRLYIEVPLPPGIVADEPGFLQNMPRRYVQIKVDTDEQLTQAQPIIAMGYERA
jgi:predicted transport protein